MGIDVYKGIGTAYEGYVKVNLSMILIWSYVSYHFIHEYHHPIEISFLIVYIYLWKEVKKDIVKCDIKYPVYKLIICTIILICLPVSCRFHVWEELRRGGRGSLLLSVILNYFCMILVLIATSPVI